MEVVFLVGSVLKLTELVLPGRARFECRSDQGSFGHESDGCEPPHADFVTAERNVAWKSVVGEVENDLDGVCFGLVY